MMFEFDEICGAVTEEESQRVGNYQGDHKPEYFQYKDEGCRRAKSCLRCPFSQCVLDQPDKRRRPLKKSRDAKINRLFHAGRKVKTLTLIFKVSPRTVYRAIKKTKRMKRNR